MEDFVDSGPSSETKTTILHFVAVVVVVEELSLP